MKKTLLLFSIAVMSFFSSDAIAQLNPVSVKVFDKVVFYDGYAKLKDEPTPEGVFRLRNDLFTTKLTPEQLNSFGDKMTLNVTIKADCDNYDRICNINLAFVPKDSPSYTTNMPGVQRIELGRFITPFMDKNKLPDEVPYSFDVPNVAQIFKDPGINEIYDLWIELQVFGVPYAAAKEITGCAGRTDCFYGTLELNSSFSNLAFSTSNNFVLPLNFQKNLNNYKAGASDEIGTTVRTIAFDMPSQLTNANLYLITSNHGAGTNGEEYSRRQHYVYFDNVQKLTYKPGETTCEPYRKYNTQSNGIYGTSAKTNSSWQSFSNWCPGSVIPIRTIPLGTLTAGSHTFKISVPTAVFYNKDGYIPVSLYLQGTSENASLLGLEKANAVTYSLYPNPTNSLININASEEVENIKVYNILGQQIWQGNTNQIDLSNKESGVYFVMIRFANGTTTSEKVIRN